MHSQCEEFLNIKVINDKISWFGDTPDSPQGSQHYFGGYSYLCLWKYMKPVANQDFL